MAIEISRADIRTDEIYEGDPRRFLKLSIKKYLDAIDVEALPSQIGIINSINSPKYRFVTAAISRRQGKTYIANIIGQVVVLMPNSSILIISPNYNLSQISFALQRKLIRKFGLEVVKENEKDRIIELNNGSTVRMGSIAQADSCVGRSYDLIIFDEAALAEGMDAFNVTLRPTLDKANSKAIFISTPRGKKNWFYELYQRGYSDEYPQWVSIRATWEDNPRSQPEDIEEARKSMSAGEFAQEYMADFNVFEGQIWNFKLPHFTGELPDDCDFICGLDIGFRDPTAFCVIAYSWEFDKYYIVDEYMDVQGSTEAHARQIRTLTDKWDADFIFIDSAAAQTKFDFAQLYDISCNNAKKDVLAGISFVASLVENDKLEIMGHCVQCLSSMNSYQWDPNPNRLKEVPLHNAACHMADAIRYALYSFQTSSNVT